MDTIDKLMQSGVDQGVFPGAVLKVVGGGKTLFQNAYGWSDLFGRRTMTLDTCFDLASLTKPLATAAAVMVLVQQGKLDLDQPCGDICSDISGSDKARITIRQLLNHSSGLPPWRPYYIRLIRPGVNQRLGALRRQLLAEPLDASPGRVSAYSDLGYMLLQWVVETIGREDLDRFVEMSVFRPLGIQDLFFNKTGGPPCAAYVYAATQLCPWRNQLMLGHVDDDNAFATGGVGGHAGLFGTADAVCRLLQSLLDADRGGGQQGVFSSEIVKKFFRSPAQERWALGFDTPSLKDSSAGSYFAPDSVGHLGFTGTSFWMDRGKKVIVVLLTNRVHPFRFHTGIKAFRPKLHNAVMQAI